MVKAPAWSQDIVNFVSCLYVHNESLGFLKSADIVLILISPSTCYFNPVKIVWGMKIYINSLVKTDSFYSNFTNTTFQKIPFLT